MKTLVIWLSSLTVCFGSFCDRVYTPHDANLLNLIPKRTKQYPLGKYKRIIVLCPPRTGSTLVYNVAKTLFELTRNQHRNGHVKANDCIVKKSHNFKQAFHPNILYICTYRDPYDTVGSRIISKKLLSNQNFINLSKDRAIAVGKCFKDLYSIKNRPNFLFLKYESFLDSFDYLFKEIESFLNIKISNFDKNLISSNLSKDKVTKAIKDYENFSEYDRISHLHGNHISQDTLTQEQKQIVKKLSTPVFKEYEAYIRAFGYSLSDE